VSSRCPSSARVELRLYICARQVPATPSTPPQDTTSVDAAAAGLYNAAGTTDASDPMERFCADVPDADECRVYED
jgi:hypothetical protein